MTAKVATKSVHSYTIKLFLCSGPTHMSEQKMRIICCLIQTNLVPYVEESLENDVAMYQICIFNEISQTAGSS